MTSGMTTRPLTADDGPLLARATLGNLNWAGERFTQPDLDRPDLAHYTRLEVARGDFGVVAQRSDEPIGVAWALFLPAEDPGYGFVDEATPEVSLWVRDDWRRRGVGSVLLSLLQQTARERGITRLSLSVETGNQARRLYESSGFTQVVGREEDGVMVWSA